MPYALSPSDETDHLFRVFFKVLVWPQAPGHCPGIRLYVSEVTTASPVRMSIGPTEYLPAFCHLCWDPKSWEPRPTCFLLLIFFRCVMLICIFGLIYEIAFPRSLSMEVR
ncbi:predicted protein [Coccidioides posadasii str. Silveira]|uniref:Predicted protein n=1 Tax=Coccidioides posadasii (strain RMSCC 757 / Silveira) TaxID=443226 RepID=E9CXH4_COCPS|nr:predicted protein [Coccidioides posadasii str. Silveira]